MTRLKQTAVFALGLLVGAVMVGLGIWQLNVYGAQGTQVAQTRADLPPVPLSQVAAPGQPVNDGYGRTVTVTGRYDSRLQLLIPLPGQPDRSRVLTALLLPDGGALPVVRGVVATGSTPAAPPSQSVEQRGILLASEAAVDSRPDSSAGPSTPGQLDSVQLAVLAQRWSPSLVNGYITLIPSEARAQSLEPAVAVLPQGQGRSRNAAYALQWWVFAAFAIAMASKMARDIGRVDDYEAALELDATGPEPTGRTANDDLADSQAGPHRPA